MTRNQLDKVLQRAVEIQSNGIPKKDADKAVKLGEKVMQDKEVKGTRDQFAYYVNYCAVDVYGEYSVTSLSQVCDKYLKYARILPLSRKKV